MCWRWLWLAVLAVAAGCGGDGIPDVGCLDVTPPQSASFCDVNAWERGDPGPWAPVCSDELESLVYEPITSESGTIYRLRPALAQPVCDLDLVPGCADRGEPACVPDGVPLDQVPAGATVLGE